MKIGDRAATVIGPRLEALQRGDRALLAAKSRPLVPAHVSSWDQPDAEPP
jgi:hypothetical protein